MTASVLALADELGMCKAPMSMTMCLISLARLT